ncbi:MAG: SbcC/MukB-like Walker B domain-containing protein, partial [Gaiellaceae bacterium]
RQGKAEQAQDALAAAEREREAALGAFRQLGRSDVFLVALGADTPPDVAEAADWTLTRALEVLRTIPPKHLNVRSSAVDLDNRLQVQCGELDRALGQQAEMTVSTERDADGLVIVRIRDGARTLTVPELERRLDEEIEQRERILTAEQRRIFHDTLLEEIAEHLRERIERVRALVEDMNATLAQCPTGSGKTVQLEWAAIDEGDADLRAMTRLLRRSVATLGEAERAPLIEFFRDRIQRARERTAIDGAAGEAGAAAHLRSAFDYRDWFAFTLYEVKDGQRVKLTPKRHALGSGGEQAVLVHMPLFAAAAALYASSRDGRAPRLVMLDEALSGIDDETREKVLGVLVALDLDVVMTSHELWGTYRTVPALSIYQLHRENGVFGVATEHFLWDGESLRELEQASVLD